MQFQIPNGIPQTRENLQNQQPAAPAPTAGNLFAGVGTAQQSMAANYFKVGQYLIRFDKAEMKNTRKSGWAAIMNHTVLAEFSGNPEANRAGEQATHMLLQKHDSFLGNVKAMIKGMAGEISDQQVQQLGDIWFEENNPLLGRCFRLTCTNIVTKSGGNFTTHNYQGLVSFAEVKNVLGEKANLYFPDNMLDTLIQQESQQA